MTKSLFETVLSLLLLQLMKNPLNVTRTLFMAVACALFIVPAATWAQGSCSKLFAPRISETIGDDPVAQLMLWEQTSNQERWFKPTENIQLSYRKIEADDVIVRTESFTPKIIEAYFNIGENVRWLRHPLNTSVTVPYKDDPSQGRKKAFYSASRSMFTKIKGSLFTFKLPTDHPHPNSRAQVGKADLNNDSIISMRRSKHIRTYDKLNKPAPELYILTEVISVASKQGNAFSVRDLRPLQDGNYYLPAFSIPYAGREIAEINKTEFNQFWEKNYGELLGQAKAQLLLRYGLQMKTPNAQNWLVQLDKNMKPTGRMYMRDVADSNYVEFVANHVGSAVEVQADRESDFTIMNSLEPYWKNSAWQMDEGGVSYDVLHSWGVTHDLAYVKTIAKVLKLSAEFNTIYEIQEFLKTKEGIKALKDYEATKTLESQSRPTENKEAA